MQEPASPGSWQPGSTRMYRHLRCASQICYIVCVASDPHGPSFNNPVCCKSATPLSHYVVDLQRPHKPIEVQRPEEVQAVLHAVHDKRVLPPTLRVGTRQVRWWCEV